MSEANLLFENRDGIAWLTLNRPKGMNAINGEIIELYEKYIPEIGIRQFLLKNVYRKEKSQFAFRFNLEVLEEHYDEIGVALPPRTIFEGPVLFLKGALSGYIAEQDKDLISAHFPNSKVVTIANSGHWLHAENPIDFYNNVVEFLEND